MIRDGDGPDKSGSTSRPPAGPPSSRYALHSVAVQNDIAHRPPMRSIHHDSGRHVAMPLGGIGTGNVSICGDGALRQWQLFDVGNHVGDLPYSFFALRVARWEPPLDEVRILQAPPAAPDTTTTPLTTDDHVPEWQRRLLLQFGGVEGTVFRGSYPFAEVDFHDGSLDLKVRLEAFTPLVPLDVEVSSMPVAMFTFHLENTGDFPLHGWLGVAAQNPVGGDGMLNPVGTRAPGYGGNVNRVRRRGAWTSLVMGSEGVDPGAAGAGEFVVSVCSPVTTALARWSDPEHFVDFLRARHPYAPDDWTGVPASMEDFQPSAPAIPDRPSPVGSTWNGGLAGQFAVEPAATAQVRVCLAWRFPNRHASFTQFGGIRPEWAAERAWLGNHYATQSPDAEEIARTAQDDWETLEARSREWVDNLFASSLDERTAEHLAAQAATIRSPSFFRDAQGAFFGFEGVRGASTGMWSGRVGGSCPLNCTHVFAYSQALAKLFPPLELSMRDTDFDILQAPDGFVPHRVIVPTTLPQMWDRTIGGPDTPALDGMLSTVLKAYREVRNGAGLDWLERRWPNIRRLIDFVAGRWDPDATGMLHGVQPSTHDIDLAGLNPFIGTLWLAALRAGEEMALVGADTATAATWRRLFEDGSAGYDKSLFNGEYYQQELEEGDPEIYQWKSGCLADQLIGQWWAHLLDLGHLLPREHVRSALRAVVSHNLRRGFRGFEHPFRTFAHGDETGLLICTWPRGGRPAVPTRYCDEVWTGVEYQVAAHCLMEGLTGEADAILDGVWGRYDGRRRNPYNEIECGDHYVRSLAGWSLLEARTGQRWNAVTGVLKLAPLSDGDRWPLLLDRGWGRISRTGDKAELECVHGLFSINEIHFGSNIAHLSGGPIVAGEERTIDLTRNGGI